MKNPTPNWLDTTIKVRYPSSPTNYRPICSILILYELFSQPCVNPHWTPASLLTKQVSDRATLRETTHSRSNSSDREPPSGTSLCGSQPSTSKKKPSTQWNTAAYKGARHRRAMHTAAHKAPRPTPSINYTPRRQKLSPTRHQKKIL